MTISNWLKAATLIFGIIGLFLLWKYGDVLMETTVTTETMTERKYERLARCGLGFLILAIALHLLTSFL